MEIKLFKHNEEAYKKITKSFETNKRVAIIHATGTGKSYISLKWLYDNKDKKCLFIAPTYEIIDQLEEYMKAEGLSLRDFPNLDCTIYPNFSRLNKKEIENLHYDNIILDEFHRCGAQEWGKSINTLLDNNQNARILGITATPTRYLDNHRNMAEELFNNTIASEITLQDAIVDGILPMPTYITAIYSFKEEIEKRQIRINQFENQEYKIKFQNKLDLAKKMLEKSIGLPELFKKHIPNKSGKYIIFCKDYEHMKKMMEESKEWFKDINPDIDIYSVFSAQGRNQNKQNIKEFENNSNNHIKLLFSIEILNEGLHVKDIDGVIMLRPTSSPIIYLQQLGRALSVGHKKKPIIFDIVNNINCYKSIFDIYTEIKNKLSHHKDSNTNTNTPNIDDFKIIDETNEFANLIESLDKELNKATLTKSKCEMIVKELIEFKLKNGRTPLKEGPGIEKKLYASFIYYKRHYTEEQIKLLEENGYNIISKTEEEKLEDLVYEILEWYDNNQKMPSGTSKDLYERSLYTRFTRNKEKFNQEQIDLLLTRKIKIESKKGMTSEDIIQSIVDKIIDFKKLNGRMPSVTKGDYEDSLYQKFIRNKTNYTEKQLKMLLDAGIEVKIASKEEIDKKHTKTIDKVESTINSLIDFKKTNGRMPSDTGETLEERSLYQIYLRTKEYYTEEQIKLLAENGIIIKAKRKNNIEEIIEDSVIALITFYLINQKMPRSKAPSKMEQSIYTSYKRNNNRYTVEQQQRIEEVGIPLQFNYKKINELTKEEQIEFYKKQIEYSKSLKNDIMLNYYKNKLLSITEPDPTPVIITQKKNS